MKSRKTRGEMGRCAHDFFFKKPFEPPAKSLLECFLRDVTGELKEQLVVELAPQEVAAHIEAHQLAQRHSRLRDSFHALVVGAAVQRQTRAQQQKRSTRHGTCDGVNSILSPWL
jgi:hypothetical protein